MARARRVLTRAGPRPTAGARRCARCGTSGGCRWPGWAAWPGTTPATSPASSAATSSPPSPSPPPATRPSARAATLVALWHEADRDRRLARLGPRGGTRAGRRAAARRRGPAAAPAHAAARDHLRLRRGRAPRPVRRRDRPPPRPRQREQAERALDLAARLHAGDRRQREPYVNHLLRVALRISVHYGVDDPDIISAALLHDAVEDHADALSPPGGTAPPPCCAARFGARVAGLVLDVTNPEYPPGADRHQAYREHVIESLTASPEARLIKASDFTDNGVGIIHTRGPKAVKLAAKYAPLVPALTDLIARPDTPLPPAVKAAILGQLLTAQERFAAITRAAGDGTGSHG